MSGNDHHPENLWLKNWGSVLELYDIKWLVCGIWGFNYPVNFSKSMHVIVLVAVNFSCLTIVFNQAAL